MKRVVSGPGRPLTILWCATVASVLVLPLRAGANEGDTKSPAEDASTTAAPDLRIHSELSPSPRRSGLAAHFAADKAHFWGCSRPPCVARSDEGLTVEIPNEARSGRRRVEVVGTKEDPALWVRWGADERFYSMIVMGSPKGEKDDGPQLVLKGWAGEKSEQKTSLAKSAAGELTLALAPEESFCGRVSPLKTRVFRPQEGRFVAVRLPVLGEKERETAERRQALPWTGDENTLVALDPKGQHSASAAVDSDRRTPWEGPFEFTELKIPEGMDEGRWIFEFPGTLKEPTALYLVVSEKVYQVEFTPSDSRRYVLEIDSGKSGCVAVVQPRTPAPIVEVMGTATAAGQHTTAELVSDLSRGESPVRDALLRLRGAETGREIAQSYAKMSPSGQARGFAISQKLPENAGLPVFVRAASTGGGLAEDATLLLKTAGHSGARALLARIKEGETEGDADLIDVLVQVDPVFAAQHLPPLLSDARTERRVALREAISRLVKVKEARGVLSAWLSATKSRTLSPDAQVELLRALEPELAHFDGAMSALQRAAASADFPRAYLLAPLLVKNFAQLENAGEILRRFLAGQTKGKPDELEKAALAAGILEALLEHGENVSQAALRGSLGESLRAENMRVRRAALLNFARTDAASPEHADAILDLLVHDHFPQVRAAAALAMGPVSGAKWGERTERVFLRRLRSEGDATVRRALVRALSAGSGEAVVKGVRWSFEKDEDYSVRAEAAISLGKLCDVGSIDALTARARELGSGVVEDGPIELGLSSVTALAHLAPDDINKRLAPLLSEEASRLTRQQVLGRIEAVRASSNPKSCR